MCFTRHHCGVEAVLLHLLNMSQSPAENQVPREGIKVVPGQEIRPGFGNFTAILEDLKMLRDSGVLVKGVKIDQPRPDRTPASMQVWPMPPGQRCTPQVLISPMITFFLCIRALQRACHHVVWLMPLCSACVRSLPPCNFYSCVEVCTISQLDVSDITKFADFQRI